MRTQRTITVLAAAAFALALAAPVTADTVYLKNGRIITSAFVRVQDDQVIIRLYEGQVAIPMSLVDRIEEDDEVERRSLPVPQSPAAPVDPAVQGDDSASADPTAGDPAQGDPAAGDPAQEGDPNAAATDPPAQPDPRESREYWQGRIQPLLAQIDAINSEISRFDGAGSADARRQVARLEADRGRLEAELDAIRLEARRLGVPAGWLR